jgi:hypothetical protein
MVGRKRLTSNLNYISTVYRGFLRLIEIIDSHRPVVTPIENICSHLHLNEMDIVEINAGLVA